MPKFNASDMTNHQIDGTGYGFSAARIDTLGSSEYTLVSIALDRSGSTTGFQAASEKAIQEIVQACQYSPRAGNLMLRLTTFDSKLVEVHGFRPLSQCNSGDYQGIANPGGATALNDASLNATEATIRYGKALTDQDFSVNGILFVITDGQENNSKMTTTEVKNSIQAAVKSESLESLRTVLIGLNTDSQLDSYLQSFKDEVGFDQYVGVGGANARSLAKLADFVSKSISSQSQSLGTGGPSQSLAF